MLLSHDAMEINHAPNPNDIIWENVSIPKSQVHTVRAPVSPYLSLSVFMYRSHSGCLWVSQSACMYACMSMIAHLALLLAILIDPIPPIIYPISQLLLLL